MHLWRALIRLRAQWTDVVRVILFVIFADTFFLSQSLAACVSRFNFERALGAFNARSIVTMVMFAVVVAALT